MVVELIAAAYIIHKHQQHKRAKKLLEDELDATSHQLAHASTHQSGQRRRRHSDGGDRRRRKNDSGGSDEKKREEKRREEKKRPSEKDKYPDDKKHTTHHRSSRKDEKPSANSSSKEWLTSTSSLALAAAPPASSSLGKLRRADSLPPPQSLFPPPPPQYIRPSPALPLQHQQQASAPQYAQTPLSSFPLPAPLPHHNSGGSTSSYGNTTPPQTYPSQFAPYGGPTHPRPALANHYHAPPENVWELPSGDMAHPYPAGGAGPRRGSRPSNVRFADEVPEEERRSPPPPYQSF